MTAEMLITILLQKRIEQKRIKATVQMVIVIVSNQEGGMVMPTRKHSQKMSVKRVKQKWRYINILGDSMLKHVKGWDLSAKLDHHHSIYVRNFSEAKVRSMKDYTKPCTREENLDHIILYVRTNDRNSDNSPERVGKSIVDSAKNLFHDNRKVAVSGIIPRNDE